jgi:hypothetical protein
MPGGHRFKARITDIVERVEVVDWQGWWSIDTEERRLGCVARKSRFPDRRDAPLI